VTKIAAAIIAGTYPVGSKLPSERDLSETLNASRGTIRKALEILEERGDIEVRSGGGVFVSARQYTVITRSAYDLTREKEGWRGLSAAIRDAGKQPFKTIISVGEVPASQDVAEKLRISPDAMVFERARIHGQVEDDGREVPLQLSWSYYVMSVADRIPEIRTPAERGEVEIRSRIVEAYRPVKYRHKTASRYATSGECDRLQLPDMAVVIDSWRTCTEEPSTIPLETTHMVMDARKIVLTY
jgi:DNA-binding GntR family transcriptional regulator